MFMTPKTKSWMQGRKQLKDPTTVNTRKLKNAQSLKIFLKREAESTYLLLLLNRLPSFSYWKKEGSFEKCAFVVIKDGMIHGFAVWLGHSYLIPGFTDRPMLLKIAGGKIFPAIEVILYFVRRSENLQLKQ